MTRTHTLSLTVTLALAALCSAIPAVAQQGPPAVGGRRGPPQDRRGAPSIDDRVQRMTTELTLSAEQAAKVKALLIAERHIADSLHGVRAVQWGADGTAMETRRGNTEKSLVALLTPDQRTKQEALMRTRRDGPGRHPRGGPDSDGRGVRRGPPDGDHRRR